ncbi:hypothetical protein WJX77_004093 [Trebouxia sp. C0004]
MQSLYGFLVLFPDGRSILQKVEDFSAHTHSGEFLASETIKALKDIGPDKFIAIVTDNAANMLAFYMHPAYRAFAVTALPLASLYKTAVSHMRKCSAVVQIGGRATFCCDHSIRHSIQRLYFIGISCEEEVHPAEDTFFRGSFLSINALDGATEWQTFLEPDIDEGYAGVAVWGSMFPIDPIRQQATTTRCHQSTQSASCSAAQLWMNAVYLTIMPTASWL